jgi:hypothetical protein
MIEFHILPRWENYRLGDVLTVAVEGWISSLLIANASKAKVCSV